jgi:hypothetical protein
MRAQHMVHRSGRPATEAPLASSDRARLIGYPVRPMSDMTDDDRQAIEGEVVSETYDGPGEWVPIALAAIRRGVSERTLRRRQDAPTPPYRQQLIGGKSHVWMPLSGIPPDNPATTGSEPDTTAVAVPDTSDTRLALAILEDLKRRDQEAQERLTRQAEEIGTLKAECDHLAAQLAEARAARTARRWWWFWER